MISEYLLEWIKAAITFKTRALLVYKRIMANLQIHIKSNQIIEIINK